MKYIDYKEQRQHGTFNFPIAFYHEQPRSPRYYMPYHWHTECEIIQIISGSFHLTINDEPRVYHAGDVLFIADGYLHGGTPTDCVYECVVFDLQALMKDNHACAKLIQDITSHKILIHTLLSEHDDEISSIVAKLFLALSGCKAGYEFKTQGYLYQLLGEILEKHLYEQNTFDAMAGERLNSLKNVLSYISDNYANNIKLEQLAKIAGMNEKYFCRYFRSMTERTPIDYVNYYRIECACEMLSTRTLSIKEIALSCGFNDESYFIKTFQKYKGITPKQFMTTEF